MNYTFQLQLVYTVLFRLTMTSDARNYHFMIVTLVVETFRLILVNSFPLKYVIGE